MDRRQAWANGVAVNLRIQAADRHAGVAEGEFIDFVSVDHLRSGG
jgi:hypothetical protein